MRGDGRLGKSGRMPSTLLRRSENWPSKRFLAAPWWPPDSWCFVHVRNMGADGATTPRHEATSLRHCCGILLINICRFSSLENTFSYALRLFGAARRFASEMALDSSTVHFDFFGQFLDCAVAFLAKTADLLADCFRFWFVQGRLCCRCDGHSLKFSLKCERFKFLAEAHGSVYL